ncbi:Histone-lysine N-methyltransferase, H3 lysine-36 specific [Hondaea fermentalgiana]|uniref:Histone-lysine N-methyltransferase, H3 lysine-36 specific n=1 Tax=Hondaea fermentalgiana TaxID=2315210 RepID=A0A2R5GNH2_9STRA|nr:Histone-lysine N-methyltransferase, H3 lysine-36 specific [Hondaea fermentalgiana]|eukprot:GBG31849.1 Histone-lysine N-methyltransferase, H3 lysine-36 specific [Hondaea fermentalgiana]
MIAAAIMQQHLRQAVARSAGALGPGAGGARRVLSTTTNLPGQQPTVAQVRKMRCTEILMDRYQPEVREGSEELSLMSRGGRAQKRFQFGSMTKSFRAKSLVTRSVKDYTEQAFIAETQLVFQEFNAALATGAFVDMRDVATEFMQERLQRNMDYDSLVDTSRLSRIVSFLEPPELLQARTVSMHQQVRDLVFAQYTVRYVTENRRVSSSELSRATGGSSRRGVPRPKKMNQFTAAQRRRTDRPNTTREPARWAVAFDEKGEYYYNTVTKQTRWDRPSNFLISPTYALCENGTLGATGRVLSEDPETGLDKVQVDVVFERPLFNLSVPWRVAFF